MSRTGKNYKKSTLLMASSRDFFSLPCFERFYNLEFGN